MIISFNRISFQARLGQECAIAMEQFAAVLDNQERDQDDRNAGIRPHPPG
jgi:hypothetical protein